MSPLNSCDTADEKVSPDAADIGDEEAAVGYRVDVRHNVVTQILIPVAPLTTEPNIS